MKKIFALLLFMVVLSMNAQNYDAETKELIKLYKANYLEWISSPEIAELQARDPELKQIIDAIPIQQTQAYRDAALKIKNKGDKEFNFTEMLGGNAKDISMDIIKELLAEENTEIIINMYWDVINGAESKEIVSLIMPHVEKAKEEFRSAGVEIANQVRN